MVFDDYGDRSPSARRRVGGQTDQWTGLSLLYPDWAFNVGWTVGEVPGTSYGLSDNGWMNGELFMGWFIDHFLKLAPQARPLLMLLDGHSSHYNPVVIRKAMEEGVIIFCLPLTNTTHITQPLDRTVFAVLKHEWNRECHHFVTASKGEIVSRANFFRLFGQAWARAMSVKNVTAGLKATGVDPLDRTAIKLPGEEPEEAVRVPSRHSAIKFVPFFTPSRRQLVANASRTKPRLSAISSRYARFVKNSK